MKQEENSVLLQQCSDDRLIMSNEVEDRFETLMMPPTNTTETYSECGDDVSDLEVISLTIFLVIVLVGNILGNVSVCWVICRDERLQRETRNIFIGSLALSDSNVAFVIVYRIVLFYGRKQHELIDSCDYFATVAVTLTYVSILHLFALSLDRYIAVMHPLRYKTIVNNRIAYLSLVVIWLTPTISMVFVPILLGTEKQGSSFRGGIIGCFTTWRRSSKAHQIHMAFNISVFLVGPFLFMLTAYGRIIKIAWYQSSRVHPSPAQTQNPTTATSAVNVTVTGPGSSQQQSEEQRKQEKRQKREMKWVKTVGIVFGAFTISYIPLFTASFVRVKLGISVVPCWLFTVGTLAVFVNSALNPVIYSLRSREYKRALWKAFGGRFRNRTVPTTTELSQRTNRLNTGAVLLQANHSLF